MPKKYILLTDDTKMIDDHKLYRIKALTHLPYVAPGDLGGYIESEDNLSHDGNCWVKDGAYVYGLSRVIDDAVIEYGAKLCDEIAYGSLTAYDGHTLFPGQTKFAKSGIRKIEHDRISDEPLIIDDSDRRSFTQRATNTSNQPPRRGG